MSGAGFSDKDVHSLLESIFRDFHYDFRGYAMASLKRRIAMALPRLGCETVSALEQKLSREPATLGALLQFLTVQVSDLFRDPPYYVAFREQVVPELATYPSPRIWIAGCSTGEEVYSLAIVLAETNLLERTTVYATDINQEALARAEGGVYPLDRMAAFSANYQRAGGSGSLSEYYTAGYGGAVFSRALKQRVVFTDHSLATDTVFAEVQAVSCRNVLIYFDRTLQDRAVGLFKDALCRRGFLGIGSSESLRFSAHARAFRGTSPGWYQRC